MERNKRIIVFFFVFVMNKKDQMGTKIEREMKRLEGSVPIIKMNTNSLMKEKKREREGADSINWTDGSSIF